jgi:hypothetical protein
LLPNGRKGVTTWDTAALNVIKGFSEKVYCWVTEVKVNVKCDVLPAKN